MFCVVTPGKLTEIYRRFRKFPPHHCIKWITSPKTGIFIVTALGNTNVVHMRHSWSPVLCSELFVEVIRNKSVLRSGDFQNPQCDIHIWCMFVRASFYKPREENQLDATEWFIALIICSTCSGYLYAHPHELETILVLLPHGVCNALVAGGRQSRAGQQAILVRPEWGKLLVQLPSSRMHSSNNKRIVSSSWWWAYKCPKHVEQIISAINHSVASSWFSSLRDTQTLCIDVRQTLFSCNYLF